MAITKYELNNENFYEVYVCGRDSAGKKWQKRKRCIETLKKAQTIEFEFKRELAQAKEQAVPFKFNEWFEVCMSRLKLEAMQSTIDGYRGVIQKWIYPYWHDKYIHTVTKNDAYELIFTSCKDIKSDWTRRNMIKMLKRLFRMAVEENLIKINPFNGMMIRTPETDLTVLNSAEVQKLLTEAKLVQHRFYPIWVFALMTGMRSGEMFALTWNDIDLESRLISVNKQWTSKNGICSTKTRRSRMVPISDELFHFIVELKLQRGQEPSVLPQLEEWRHGEQASVLRQFCDGIGITSVRFHDLRATFITNLLALGETLVRVMAIVGHSEMKTTNGYLRKAGIDVKGGTDKLSFKVPRGMGTVVELKAVRQT
jgi:integrase